MKQQHCVKIAVAAIALAFGFDAAAQSSTGTAAPAKSTGKSSLSGDERKFLETAARDGMAEVEMGKIAQQKAQAPQVKEFGGRMVQDHTKANEELKQLASAKGVTLPAELDAKHKKHAEDMQKKSGESFDREYMSHMVGEHKKDVSAFEKQAKGAKDPDVKAFAQKTLPVLQSHRQAAQATRDVVAQAGNSGGDAARSDSAKK